MEYSKADRRAVIALAIVACCIVAGIVLFGQRELPIVQAPPIPQEFLKALKVSKDYKDFNDYESYKSYRANKPYKSHRFYDDYKSSGASEYTERSASPHPSKFSQPTVVELNSADTTLLQRIPGIGQNIARWIVQRRERLGGFMQWSNCSK